MSTTEKGEGEAQVSSGPFAGTVAALRRWAGSLAVSRGDLRRDAIAGIPGAVGSVPDGMAASVLAGVNPVHGLYASFAGPIFGGLTANTRLMVITATSAAALAAGSALSGFDQAERDQAILLLTLLAGALMVLAGLFHLGRYTRFVALSVMLGCPGLPGVGDADQRVHPDHASRRASPLSGVLRRRRLNPPGRSPARRRTGARQPRAVTTV